PRVLRAPKNLFGLPDVFASEAEPERLEAHRLERDVAGEHDQVSPRDLLPVLLLDRPQQTTGFVEVRVVGPAVERCEPLRPVTTAPASVRGAVRARRVPRHADEQRS